MDPAITLDQLRAEVTWMSREDADRWALAHDAEPAFCIQGIGPDGKAETVVLERYGKIYADIPRQPE